MLESTKRNATDFTVNIVEKSYSEESKVVTLIRFIVHSKRKNTNTEHTLILFEVEIYADILYFMLRNYTT